MEEGSSPFPRTSIPPGRIRLCPPALHGWHMQWDSKSAKQGAQRGGAVLGEVQSSSVGEEKEPCLCYSSLGLKFSPAGLVIWLPAGILMHTQEEKCLRAPLQGPQPALWGCHCTSTPHFSAKVLHQNWAFSPSFPPFWMLDNERESSKGFPRPSCPEHPCKKWQLPTAHPSLPHGKGAARAKSWVCLPGGKLCLSLGVFHLCSIKEKRKKKKTF